MRRRSKYHELKWLVEARWPGNAYWEPIAAYNHERVATDYADANAKAAKRNGIGFDYRVLARKGNKWIVIHITEAKEAA